MKKFISILLIIALCFSVMPASAFAADTDLVVSLTTESGRAVNDLRAGDVVIVKVALPNAASVGGATVRLKYDTSKFEVIKDEAKTNSVMSAGVTYPNTKYPDSISAIHLNMKAENDNWTTETNLLTAAFKVKNAVNGTAEFSLSEVSLLQYDGVDRKNLGFTAPTATKVSIYSEITGDQSIAITAPVKGATPQTDITEGSGYTGVVTWTPAVSSSPSDVKFAANTAYTATVTLTAKDYYKFAADATASVAGATIQNLQVVADGTALTFEAVFPTTADKVLTTLEITKAAD